tara:strand:- start:98 stop:289 length:192 start_codon:yes stop_codon:yes gene_type:complete
MNWYHKFSQHEEASLVSEKESLKRRLISLTEFLKRKHIHGTLRKMLEELRNKLILEYQGMPKL